MKRFLFIFAIVLVASGLHAQKERFKGELYVGAGGGALFSNVDFVPTVLQTNRMGFHGGVAAKYISEKNLGVIGEINFSQRGWTEEFEAEKGFSYSRSLNYIDIPLMTHVYFGRNARFILNAGPQVSFLIGDKQTMNQALADDVAARKAADPNAPIGVQYSPSASLKRVDYGLIGGVGMALKTGLGDFDLEGRYYFGLGDIFENRRSKNSFFSRSANRVIEAKLTYYIKIR